MARRRRHYGRTGRQRTESAGIRQANFSQRIAHSGYRKMNPAVPIMTGLDTPGTCKPFTAGAAAGGEPGKPLTCGEFAELSLSIHESLTSSTYDFADIHHAISRHTLRGGAALL